jgi:hypothetical protein
MGRTGRRIETALAVEAAGQWGMFTAAQALRLGMARDRLAQLTAAERIAHTSARGVYRFAGAPDDITVDDLRAAWLSLQPDAFAGERIRTLRRGGTDAIVSHLSAAHYVYGLGTQHPDRLDFTVFTSRRSSNVQIVLHRAEGVDWQLIAGLPVTTIPQTIADVYREGIDAGHLGDILIDALATAATDLQTVATALDPLTDDAGRGTVMHALAVVGAPDSIAAGNELLFSARR